MHDDPATTTNTPPPLDAVWYTRSPVPTPLGLAAQLGWFLDEFRGDGIDVFTVQDSDDVRVLASHRDHHLAHSFRQGGNLHALWARARGRQTRVIGLHWLDEYQAILALPGRGIRTPSDLRGARIALPHDPSATVNSARASALRGVHVVLDVGGVAPSDVSFVDVASARPAAFDLRKNLGAFGEYGELAAALVNGHVDAVYVKGAHGVQMAAHLKAQVVFDLRSHPDALQRANHGAPRPITVDQALLETRPDIVARFLGCIVDVADWAAAHRPETLSYLARETYSSEHSVTQAYGADVHRHQRIDFADSSVRALAACKDFYLAHGLLERDFDLDTWLDQRPLQQVLAQRTARQAARV